MIAFLRNCWQEDYSRRILWIPVLFALGIGIYFALPQEPSKWLTLFGIETLILAAILFRHYLDILKFIGCLAVILAGFAVVQIKSIWLYTEAQNLPEETFYFKGKIVATDTNYQGKRRFILENLQDFDDNIYAGKYRITQRAKDDDAEVGQCVEMIGKISPLAKEVVVGGYQFDRKGYFEGLKGSGFAESRWFATDCSAQLPTSGFSAFIANLRRKTVKHIQSILPPEEASVAAAVIAGEKGGVSEAQYEQYRNSGLAHFLSISGLHMSMLAGLTFFLIRLILALFPAVALRADTKKIAALFAIVISLAYLFISGQAVPAQRAFIMTFIVLLGVLTNRRAISMYSIALAAGIVLFIAPEVLVSASFQMSFAAVLGLIAFYEKVARRIQIFLQSNAANKYIKCAILYISGVVISDLIASLMTLPFAIYHFNMVAIYTTLGNLLAGPIIGLIIMPFVLLSLLFMPLGFDAPFLKIVGWGISWVNEITSWVSSLPYAGYQVPSMPFWGLILIVGGGLWLMLWQAKWRYFGVVVIILGISSLGFVQTPDILVGAEGRAIAFKNAENQLEIVSSRSGNFIKNIWNNKYPAAERKAVLAEHPEFKIERNTVEIDGRKYDLQQALGMSVYRHKNGEVEVRTIRNDIGQRLWNKD